MRERHRLAGDLHDTVGHGLILIAMQARQLGVESPPLRGRLRQIEESAQESLQEIRRVVGVLHAVEQDERKLTQAIVDVIRPVPPTAQEVILEVLGTEDELDASVRGAALRVIKEGITNSIKYAPGQQTHVIVGFGENTTITVRNTPLNGQRTGSHQCFGKTGFGLAGLREHVAQCGGTFWQGRTMDGGFEISAVFGEVRAVQAAGHRCAS